MGELYDRQLGRVSGGQAQRVAIARALVHDPRNVILDEPTNGLDVMTTRGLRSFLRDLRAEGRCVIFSSHIMQEVAALCDRIVVVARGEVRAIGTPDELRAQTGLDRIDQQQRTMRLRQLARSVVERRRHAAAGVAFAHHRLQEHGFNEPALGLGIGDIDIVELNEAFAAQALACTREWDFGKADFERTNVNGSGISLGHPIAATGVRMAASLLHELKRRKGRYGLETMCVGGGQGVAAVFEAA